jgi:hypothetical protein
LIVQFSHEMHLTPVASNFTVDPPPSWVREQYCYYIQTMMMDRVPIKVALFQVMLNWLTARNDASTIMTTWVHDICIVSHIPYG